MSPDMRINAGKYKGRKIASVDSGDYRPTTGIIKKCLFDMIGEDITDSRFLDLFCGTGPVGIEALSRGSGFVAFLDSDHSRTWTLEKNLDKLGIDRDSIKVITNDFADGLQKLMDQEYSFDLIYIDPPYNSISPGRILGAIVQSRVLEKSGLIIYEAGRNEVKELLGETPSELYPLKERVHGGTALVFFRWRDEEIRDMMQ